ncbi:MAG: hypothetical protein KA479_09570 [Saprospiraceae bacterium]|nr:hypothetical protein [Saprospiraceae bacterium]
MKQDLMHQLQRAGLNFTQTAEGIIIQDETKLEITIRFEGETYSIHNKLRSWNNLTGPIEMSIKSATNYNFWGFFVASFLFWRLLSKSTPEDGMTSHIGITLFLLMCAVLCSTLNMIYWSRYNMLVTLIHTWMSTAKNTEDEQQ